MEMNAIKATLQKWKSADKGTDDPATETGILIQKIKESNEMDNSNGPSTSQMLVTGLPDNEENKTDGQVQSNKKKLTWGGIQTAAVPAKLIDWCKAIFTNMRPWSESNNLK